jgi:porphobilinogen synthase
MALLRERPRIEARMRRLRRTQPIRELVRETRIHASNLVAPIFVKDGTRLVEPIDSMPGVNRYSVDKLRQYVGRVSSSGVRSVLLFGIPRQKDELGSSGYSSDGVVPRAIREIKSHHPDMVVIADVCLCEYTSHGHCGVIRNGTVDNDETLPLLARAAVAYARSGADIVAPSAMMDGQVRSIRAALESADLDETAIMSYSAKYSSSFYGPFREAAGSKPAFGDRKSYQMDPPNSSEAMREIANDIKEGADIVMVKPALAYLDIVSKARARFDVPIAAYNVSGEYSMVKAAGANGWLDEMAVAEEVLTAIKRAGASIIITYFAEQMANRLKETG